MQSDAEWRIVRGRCHPAMHMALDEVITDRVANGEAQPTLRFWEWDRSAVVIGRFQRLRDEVFEDMARKYEVSVVRRMTGGGAMFTEPGRVITYSLSFPEHWLESASITDSYRELEDWSVAALQDLGIDAAHKPINDIVHGDQKIGGSAQARRNGAVLHHTMMAYDMDIEKMLKVLKIGEEKISDKAIKSAEKRVAPIKTVADVPRQEVIDQLLAHFTAHHDGTEGQLTDEELEAAKELMDDQYNTHRWTYLVDREIDGR